MNKTKPNRLIENKLMIATGVLKWGELVKKIKGNKRYKLPVIK